MTGRPTKLTPGMQEKILEYIRKGLPIVQACAASGIHKDTYYEWLKRAKKKRQPYADFADALGQAEGVAQASLVNKLQDEGGPTSWQFILERRWPGEWGRKDKLQTENETILKVEWPDDE